MEKFLSSALPALLSLMLVLIAYFNGRAASSLVGQAVLKMDADEIVRAMPPRPRNDAIPPPRPPSASAIIDHNIFDHATDLSPEPTQAAPAATTPPVPTIDLSDPLRADACEDVDVKIVTESINPEKSIAVFDGDERGGVPRQVGDDFGDYTVEYIGFNRLESSPAVWLTTETDLCQALLFEDPKADKKSAQKSKKRNRSRAQSKGKHKRKRRGRLPDAIAQRIERVSDTEYNIDRAAIDDILEKKSQLMRGLRMIPQKGKNGKNVGVRLFGVRQDTLLSAIGVRNGDRVESINGFSLTNPEKALQAYARLRTADNLTVELTRRGKPMSIDLNIK